MKNLRSVLTVLAVLLTATAAQAQRTAVSATVPFNFVVGDRAYPAGEYSFTEKDTVLQIANSEQTVGVVLSNACANATPATKTKLVFHRMGDYYFLDQIWIAGHGTGRELTRSRTEIRLAENHEKMETVIVAANISK